MAAHRHPHARVAHPAGVLLPLVAEGVEPRGHQVGRRQRAQVLGEDRGGAGVAAPALVGEVVVAKPVHLRLAQQEALLEGEVRRALRREVADRIDQELEGGGRAVARAHEPGRDGGEVASGAVAADRDPCRVDAEGRRVVARPLERGRRVLDGGRERVLRSHPVVHGQHGHAGVAGEEAADALARHEVADHEAAAVEVEEHPFPGSLGHVQAGRKPAPRAGDVQIVRAGHRLHRAAGGQGAPDRLLPGRGHRHLLDGGAVGAARERDHQVGLVVQRQTVDRGWRAARHRPLQRGG